MPSYESYIALVALMVLGGAAFAAVITDLVLAALVPNRYKSQIKPLLRDVRSWLIGNQSTTRALVPVAIVALLLFVQVSGAFAQSVTIDFGPDDLDSFFTWFNMMFSAILPIVLIGAALTAGGLFAIVIGRMFVNAFTNMLSSLGGRR